MDQGKRRREGAAECEDDASALKRHKSAVDEAFAELVCPITQGLPVDPVMAEDDKVYERYAIEEWLKKHKRSPATNLPMDDKVRPALHVRNMIRGMVKSGALSGEKADAWQERLKEEQMVAEAQRQAVAGDGSAMRYLGGWYSRGEKGLPRDPAKAFDWFFKSHEAGNVTGTSGLGNSYLIGMGVEKCTALGIMHLTEAAHRGSKAACCILGSAFSKGIRGFPKDMTQARRWFSMVAVASVNDAIINAEEFAANFLRENPA